MRIGQIVTILICCIVLLSSCSYKEYYTNTEEYTSVWELSGFIFQRDEKDILFPTVIADLNVMDFFCRYDAQLPLGEGIQVYLQVQYDQLAFDEEMERIAMLGEECTVLFNAGNVYKEFTSSLNEEYYDYALIDEIKQTVQYIYIQSLKEEEIEFSHDLLPTNYDRYGFKEILK